MKKFSEYLENNSVVSESKFSETEAAVDYLNKIMKDYGVFGKALEKLHKTEYPKYREVEKKFMEFRSIVSELQASLMSAGWHKDKQK